MNPNLNELLDHFGVIDKVKSLHDVNCANVHMMARSVDASVNYIKHIDKVVIDLTTLYVVKFG